jgi:predicted DNA-binding protein
MVMKRTNFYFPPQMLTKLKAASKKTGLPVSELIRRAVEDLLKKIGVT